MKYQEQIALQGKARIGTLNLAAGQTCITSRVQRLSSAEKNDTDLTFTRAVYINNLPFNLTQSPYFLAPFQRISPAYKPPSPYPLCTTLFDQPYLQVTDDVEKVIQSSYSLNIMSEEGKNKSKDRIINITVNTSRGTFPYSSENAGSMSFMAENLASWLMARLGVLVKGDSKRINSFATDTYSTMLLLWRILAAEQRLQLSKALSVLCDSHSL